MLRQAGYPVIQACQWLGLSHSSFYYAPIEREDTQIELAIQSVANEYVPYGTRRVTHQLRRSPYRLIVNRKRVQRIMRQKGLLRPVKRRKCRTTDSQHPYPRYPNLVKDLEVVYPDQVWTADITYIRLLNEFVYLAVILDIFTRKVRGWCLSRQLDQELTLAALRMALLTGTAPHIHHSDQGVQYAALAYVELLKMHQIQISMAAVGKAEENGFAERFMRTIKEEEVDLSEYQDFADAQQQIGFFIEAVYNHKRIHSALDYLTPVEFELAWRLALTQPVQQAPFSRA
jgi:putative transposase